MDVPITDDRGSKESSSTPLDLAPERGSFPSPLHILSFASDRSVNSNGGGRESEGKYYIYIVAGPKGSEHSQKLGQWARACPHKTASVRLHEYGGPKGDNMKDFLAQESRRLAKKLEWLGTPKIRARRGSSDGKQANDKGEHMSVDEQSQSSNPYIGISTFILVGHGLGCRIIRKLMNNYHKETFIINTIAAIFLDDIDGGSRAQGGVEESFAATVSFLRQQNYNNLEILELSPCLKRQARNRKRRVGILPSKLMLFWTPFNNDQIQQVPAELKTFDQKVKEILQEHQREDNAKLGGSTANPWTGKEPPSTDLGYLSSHGPSNTSLQYQASVSTTSEEDDPPSVREYLEIATMCIQKGDFKLAFELLTSKHAVELSDDPELTDQDKYTLSLYRTIATMHMGNYGAAVRTFKDLPHKHPGLTDPQLVRESKRSLGQCYTLDGRYLKAVQVLGGLLLEDQDIKTDQETIRTRTELAYAHACLGKYPDAQLEIHHARKALTMREAQAEKEIREEATGTTQGKERVDVARSRPENLIHLQDQLCLAEAQVSLMCGDYLTGLRQSERAWDGMRNNLGRKNITTLQAGRLYAFLLALNSEADKAESICRTVLDSMQSVLGPQHPDTLEAKFVLIFIFRAQGRYKEAVNIGKAVGEQMTKISPRHLRTLDLKAELAVNYRLAGDYIEAARELWDTVNVCKSTHGVAHPNTLRYTAKFAHICLLLGYPVEAEQLTLRVLVRQRDIYSRGRGHQGLPSPKIIKAIRDRRKSRVETQKPNRDLLKDPGSIPDIETMTIETIIGEILIDTEFEHQLKELVKYLDSMVSLESFEDVQTTLLNSTYKDLLSQLSDWESTLSTALQKTKASETNLIPEKIAHEVGQEIHQKYSKLLVHPFLLRTLETTAAILCQKPTPNSSLGIRILEGVLQWRQPDSSITSTLTTKYSLAVDKRDRQQGQDLSDSIELLDKVYHGRTSLLGASHPDTLTAKRELLVTICAEGPSKNSTILQRLIQPVGLTDGNASNKALSEDEGFHSDIWDRIEHCSGDILSLQEERLGKPHPQTLTTLLWMFAIQIDLQDGQSQAHATADSLLQRLRLPSVRRQRLYEARAMEKRLENFYDEYEEYDAAANIKAFLRKEDKNAVDQVKENAQELLLDREL